MPKGGWTYILTNRPNGTLYIGVTSNLIHRLTQHQTTTADSFTTRYGLPASSTPNALSTSATPSPARNNSNTGTAPGKSA